MGKNKVTWISSAAAGFLAAALATAQPATTGLIATDAGHDRIIEFTLPPNELGVLWEGAPLNEPTAMISWWSPATGHEFIVCNKGDGSIVALNPQMQTHRTLLAAGLSPITNPADIEVTFIMKDILFILDKHDGAVHRFNVEWGMFVDIIVAPLAPASSMTMMWGPSSGNYPILAVAYPSLGKVNRYDGSTGALLNTVAEVENPVWVGRNYYADVGVIEDVADPTAPDRLRWYTQEGTPRGVVSEISSGVAPNDLYHGRYGSEMYLLFDERLEAVSSGASITGKPGSQFGSLILFKECYANCDPFGELLILNIFDFLCFQNSFVKGEAYACDCDTSTGNGVCDIFDFLCYQSAFVMGCP